MSKTVPQMMDELATLLQKHEVFSIDLLDDLSTFVLSYGYTEKKAGIRRMADLAKKASK